MDSAHAGSAVLLRLHADVYPLEAIERAAAAFLGRAQLDVRAGSPHHTVTIDAPRGEQVASEFANWVLATALVGGPADHRGSP